MNPTVGSSIGPYRLTGLIGQGGMGLVYLAEHVLIGKKVAVKTVRPELIEHAGVAERFINEARAVNTIGDEHIVDIYDAGQTPDGVVYCVMELLIGESLHEFSHRRGGKIDLDLAVEIVLQIARALQICHEKGIIHRDLKPANVFILTKNGAPFVKILDFGIAKLVGQSSASTNSNAIIGTPFYMAPEQCRGSKDLDHRIDVYALGVILYELATGTLPFEGQSAGDVIIKQATELVEDPRVRNPKLPDYIARVILHALEKQREDRFPSMSAFGAALEARGEGLPDYARPSRKSLPPVPRAASSLRSPPTQSLMVTPLDLQGRDFSTPSPSVAPPTPPPGQSTAPDTARRAEPAEPQFRPASKVPVVLAAIVVLALVIVAGRFVMMKTPTDDGAGSRTPAAEAPLEAAPEKTALPVQTAEPAKSPIDVTPTTPTAALPAEPAPSAAVRLPTTPVVIPPRRPVTGARPAQQPAPARPIEVTPVDTKPAEKPAEPAPKASTKDKGKLDSLLPPETLLPP